MSQSLEDLLKTKNPVDLLRNSQIGAYVYPVVPAEYRTGGMNSVPGETLAFCSTSPITWPTCTWKAPMQ